jgi:uncharacterized protein with HEPN domain
VSRDPTDRLRDILDCIRKARNADRLLLRGDEQGDQALVETAFDAVERNLFVIGEAAKDLPDDVLDLAPEVDWKAVKGLRDVLGHEYFRIVPAIVHTTVRKNLDPLETAVVRILEQQF